MPRIPNTRLTSIYWLFDTRPEALAKWPFGYPFYCGKTIVDPIKRLAEHQRDKNRHPNRAVSNWLIACGDQIAVSVIEVVTIDADWRERERFWIRMLRLVSPDCANVSDGGEGTPGAVHSAQARAKMSALRKGKKFSPEHRAKIAAANRKRIVTDETRARQSAAKRGNRSSVGRVHSPETRAKMRLAKKGKPLAPEHLAKLVESRRLGRLERRNAASV